MSKPDLLRRTAGINDLTMGSMITVVSACVTFCLGLKKVPRDVTEAHHKSGDVPEWHVRIIVQHEAQTVAPS
jgi:hypothetical protein